MRRLTLAAIAALLVAACVPQSPVYPSQDELAQQEKPGGSGDKPGGSTDNPGGSTDNPGGNTDNPGGGTDNPGGGTDNPGGGGETSSPDIRVETGDATSVTVSTAVLNGSWRDLTGEIREVGFEWGTSASSLPEVLQADLPSSGDSFQATLDGLGDGHTYYFRAYAILQDGDRITDPFYGAVVSFTTQRQDDKPSGANSVGWFELPLMNVKATGDFLSDANDSQSYFAYHLCSGGEKGPTGRTARNYTVCYSGKYHCPVWVAAPRHAMYVGSAGRNDSYRKDPDIPGDIQYKSKSTGGGCNKGHMLGSAERTSSTATNKDVFFYTNIAPQLSSGFNTGGGGWNILEDWVDGQVCADTLYEVVGCYFQKFTDGYGETVSPKIIDFGGRSDVAMPTMFYYVLLRTKKGNSGKSVKDLPASELKCAAFVRSHTNNHKGRKVSSKEMMSVEALEKITGITYFPSIPNAPKSTLNASDWGL